MMKKIIKNLMQLKETKRKTKNPINKLNKKPKQHKMTKSNKKKNQKLKPRQNQKKLYKNKRQRRTSLKKMIFVMTGRQLISMISLNKLQIKRLKLKLEMKKKMP